MISYKKINLLDISLSDGIIKCNDSELEIKSPIMMYEIKDNKLLLNINENSDPHNLFLNICEYIDRLFKIKEINTEFMQHKKIIIDILDNSKFYNDNSKNITIKNVKIEGKTICSFIASHGKFKLKNFLLIV